LPFKETSLRDGACFSPDGRWVATATRERASVWDAATGTKIYDLDGHKKTTSCVSFSPDGQRLATSSDDGTVNEGCLDHITADRSRQKRAEIKANHPQAGSTPDAERQALGAGQKMPAHERQQFTREVNDTRPDQEKKVYRSRKDCR
jgi:hypothetical protein